MPFVQIDCTPRLLATLGLSETLDPKHPYRYEIFEHCDGTALLIFRSYQHLSETFHTELLRVREIDYVVETKTSCEYANEMWNYTLTAIRIYCDSTDPTIELSRYLPDLLSLYPSRHPYTAIPSTVHMEVTFPS